MPKLYEYFGLIVLFYSDEHEPIHVHGLPKAANAARNWSSQMGML